MNKGITKILLLGILALSAMSCSDGGEKNEVDESLEAFYKSKLIGHWVPFEVQFGEDAPIIPFSEAEHIVFRNEPERSSFTFKEGGFMLYDGDKEGNWTLIEWNKDYARIKTKEWIETRFYDCSFEENYNVLILKFQSYTIKPEMRKYRRT